MPAPDGQPPAPEKAEPAAGGRERPEAADGEVEKEAAQRAVEAILALRDRAKPVTVEEILTWRHEGHQD